MKTRMWVGPILRTVSVCLLAIGVLAANPALAQEIRGTFAGSYFPILSDYDDDGLPNSVTSNETSGVSTVLGRFTSRSFGASVFEGEYCSGTEVKLNWVDDTAVYTAANGDVLYAVLAQDSGELDSHLCFNFIDNTWRAIVYLEISGGTGRFAGATGQLIVSSTGVLAASGLGGFWQGALSGDVVLAKQ